LRVEQAAQVADLFVEQVAADGAGKQVDGVMRRLFLRAAMDSREVKILRGILSEAQRMARLARGPGA